MLKIALEARDENEHSFPCKHCDDVFKKKILLNQHNFKVHEIQFDTEYTCTQCGVSCASLPGLKAHNHAHPARKFLCASCDKSFTKSRSLKKRTLTQDPEQQFKCHHCSKRFVQKII